MDYNANIVVSTVDYPLYHEYVEEPFDEEQIWTALFKKRSRYKRFLRSICLRFAFLDTGKKIARNIKFFP